MDDENYYISLLLQALKIFSPSGNEKKFAEFLYNFLIKHHFKNVRYDKAGNVIGEIGRGAPVLLLASHMDTINDFIEVKEEKDRIYGRGAVDAKGPLMALAIASSKFCDKDFNGKIIFAGIVKEEISTDGIETFLNNNRKIDFAIFSEPNNTKNIVVAYKGRTSLKVKLTSNKGIGHPAISWLFKNSIELAFQYYNQIKGLCNTKYKGRTPYFSVIPTITEFKSAEGKNIIPSWAEFYLDIRYPYGIDIENIFKEIDEIKLKFMEKNDCVIEHTIISNVYPYSVNPKIEFIKYLSESIEEILNEKSKLTRKTGTTFMNVIGNTLKIPTISYGPGDPTLEHTKGEYILKEDFLNSIKILELFIKKFFMILE